MYHGEFNSFLNRVSAENLDYRILLSEFSNFKPVEKGKPDKSRMQDIEMVLRFFYLLESNFEFSRFGYPTKEQLNSYMRAKKEQEKHREDSSDVYTKSNEELEAAFNKVCHMVRLTFKGNHFKKFSLSKNKTKFSVAFNKAFFDIQMLGFVDYEVTDISGLTDVIYNEFIELCYFNAVMMDNTNEKISERINTWKWLLFDILTDDKLYYINKLNGKVDCFNYNPICLSCSEKVEELHEGYFDVENNAFYHAACYIKDNNASPNIRTWSRFDFSTIEAEIEIFLSYNGKNSNGIKVKAQGVITKKGVIVKSGSGAVINNSSSLGVSSKNKKNELITQGVLVEKDNCLSFSTDYLFNSFSTPAEIILGSSANGKEQWKTSNGTSLKELGF